MKHGPSVRSRVRTFAAAIGCLAFFSCVLAPLASAAECTNTWTGAAEGSWATAGNWSAKHVPTSTEVACIGSGKTVNITSGSRQVKMLQGEGSVVVSATLEVLSTTESSKISGLALAGGTLKGAATVQVSGSLTWTEEDTMSGTGSTVLLSGATASISGARVNLKKRRFSNEGTLTSSTGK